MIARGIGFVAFVHPRDFAVSYELNVYCGDAREITKAQ
jgi:hypothetical protein